MKRQEYLEKIRRILSQHGRLATAINELLNSSDLYEQGMTSLATVSVMSALEEQFEVEFPDNMLERSTFQSIDSIVNAVEQLNKKSTT